MKRWLMALFLMYCVVVSLLGVAATAGELVPPVMVEPLPEAYQDANRQFQGISSIAVTSNQDVWVTWYSGGTDENQFNYVLLSRSRDGGRTWSKPLFALDQPGEPREYDPSIWFAPNGRLYLFWAQRPGQNIEADLWMISTGNPNDDKPVWSKPAYVTNGVMMNKPIADSKGRWCLPVSVWNLPYWSAPNLDRSPNGPAGAWFVISEDSGKTWKKLGRAYTPPEAAVFDEHSIVELKDGRFWIMNRTQRGCGEFFSSDGGKTWTDFQDARVKHTSSRFFLRRMQSGNLLLIKNGPVYEDVGRRQITAFLSKDDGQTWEGGLMLDERLNTSYPDADQAPDGTIYVTYDFERYGAKEIYATRITEADVLAGKLVSPQSQLRIIVNKALGQSVPPTR